MSWRHEAKSALRAYPRLLKKQTTLSAAPTQTTPNYNGVAVRGGEASRSAEEAALRSVLSERERAQLEAVRTALELEKKYPNADARLRMIDLVYFRRTHTLEGAAEVCRYSIETVKRWNAEIQIAVYAALRV